MNGRGPRLGSLPLPRGSPPRRTPRAHSSPFGRAANEGCLPSPGPDDPGNPHSMLENLGRTIENRNALRIAHRQHRAVVAPPWTTTWLAGASRPCKSWYRSEARSGFQLTGEGLDARPPNHRIALPPNRRVQRASLLHSSASLARRKQIAPAMIRRKDKKVYNTCNHAVWKLVVPYKGGNC